MFINKNLVWFQRYANDNVSVIEKSLVNFTTQVSTPITIMPDGIRGKLALV